MIAAQKQKAIEVLKGYEDSSKLARDMGLSVTINLSPSAAAAIFYLARERLTRDGRFSGWTCLMCFWAGAVCILLLRSTTL